MTAYYFLQIFFLSHAVNQIFTRKTIIYNASDIKNYILNYKAKYTGFNLSQMLQLIFKGQNSYLLIFKGQNSYFIFVRFNPKYFNKNRKQSETTIPLGKRNTFVSKRN